MATNRELDWEVHVYGKQRHAIGYIGKRTVYSFTARTRLGLNLGILWRSWWWNLTHG
jgi:hypothetical protein